MTFRSGEWVTEDVIPRTQPVIVQQEKKMVAVLPFIEKEIEAVKSFLRRSNQLAGQIPRTTYLLPFKGINTTEIRKEAEMAFSQVGFILDSEGVNSDWQGRQLMRSAAGPNSLFRQATWHFYLKKIGPWLWLEPDCWPLAERWFYELEREYFDSTKPFMGVKMRVADGREYMNGVGVYPWNAVQYAPLLVQASMWTQHPTMEVGFDIAGGADVLAKAHITRKIQLMGALARGTTEVRPETVLCHGRIDLSGGNAMNVCDSSTVQSGIPREFTPSTQNPLSAGENEADNLRVQKSSSATADTNFLDRGGNSRPPNGRSYGAAGEPPTKVFGDASPHAAPCVPLHETPVQERPSREEMEREYRKIFGKENVEPPSQTKNGGSEYGGLSKEIRTTVQHLAELWDQQPHRKVLIVKELRKAKLVPKHFR